MIHEQVQKRGGGKYYPAVIGLNHLQHIKNCTPFFRTGLGFVINVSILGGG